MANLITKSINSLNAFAEAKPLDNFSTAGVIISGTWSGILSFEGSLDGTTFVPILCQQLSLTQLTTTTSTNGQFLISTSGLHAIRITMTTYTSGTANIVIQANAAPFLQRSLSTLAGDTDGTKIGNIGDRLKTDAQVTITPSPGTIPSVSSKLRYLDLNTSVGGVARGTLISNSWVKVYDYSGNGIVIGMILNIEEKDKWYIRLVIDNEEIFGSSGIFTGDLTSDSVYDLDEAGNPLSASEGRLGISMEEHDRFAWSCASDFPVRYSSSVEIYVRRSIVTSKKFQAGLLITTRES